MTSFANTVKAAAFIAALAAAPAFADDAAPAYNHEVLTRISTHAVYPRAAAIAAQEGVVTVAVSLDKAGNLTGVQLLQRSGVPSIDMAAIQAAKDASPYPAPTSAADTVVRGRIRFAL
jgi:TonB family protein